MVSRVKQEVHALKLSLLKEGITFKIIIFSRDMLGPGIVGNTVDGRNPANQLIGSLSHCLQGFVHSRWCRISAINSIIIFFGFSVNGVVFQVSAHSHTIGVVGKKSRVP